MANQLIVRTMVRLLIKDEKNQGTLFMVKKLPDTNLNVVVRVVLETDEIGWKNSVMTLFAKRT